MATRVARSKVVNTSMIVRMTAWAAWMIGLTVIGTSAVEACVICVPYPKTTHADRLMQSETVVMARENPNKPYSFAVVDVLKGASDNQAIEVFVNAVTRQRLRQNADHVIILVRQNAEAEWEWIAYADRVYQTFIRAVLARSDGWLASEGHQTRLAFFSAYLTHTHQRIREQAYLEVGRAPYTWIQAAAGSVPRAQIRAFLAEWRLVDWHSLYILMLGQSHHPDDRAYIRQKFEAAARYHLTTNLSAWATAFVEAHPASGIEEIEALYFGNDDRTRDELEAVVQALSVLGAVENVLVEPGIAERRRRIVNGYATLLDHHPTMAGWVARDLTIWQRNALVDRLSNIMRTKTILDPGSAFALNYYLSMAPRFSPFGAVN